MLASDQLVGAWTLVAWTITTANQIDEPFGPDAAGLLTYTADGAMQASIARGAREPLSGPSSRRSPDDEVAEAARSYFSYAGTWRLDGEVVVHDVTMSLDPGFVGTQQRRVVDLDGDRLVLSAEEPVGEVIRRHELVWQRHQVETTTPPGSPT